MSEVQGYGTAIGILVSAIAAIATIRQWYVHRGDETAKNREDREAAEQERRESRYDAGVWKLVEELRVEVGRLSEKVNTLEGRLDEEQRVNAELRADLNIARATIREQERKINEVERRQS